MCQNGQMEKKKTRKGGKLHILDGIFRKNVVLLALEQRRFKVSIYIRIKSNLHTRDFSCM